jgi:hypothetical protein
MQRNFEPMRKQVEAWQKSELTDVTVVSRQQLPRALKVLNPLILALEERNQPASWPKQEKLTAGGGYRWRGS